MMECYANRLQSFEDNGPWPLARPVPAQLAAAGFYYEGIDDNVVCFTCNKSLGGWDADDRPLAEHVRHSPGCKWAQFLQFAEDRTHDTRSKTLDDLRANTFARWWPHEKKRGFVAKTKKMAKAGLYYNPTTDSDDMASCLYCGLGLDGWEPSDDPTEEHRKRSPDCFFFRTEAAENTARTVKRRTSNRTGYVNGTLGRRPRSSSVISVCPDILYSEQISEKEEIHASNVNTVAGTRRKRVSRASSRGESTSDNSEVFSNSTGPAPKRRRATKREKSSDETVPDGSQNVGASKISSEAQSAQDSASMEGNNVSTGLNIILESTESSGTSARKRDRQIHASPTIRRSSRLSRVKEVKSEQQESLIENEPQTRSTRTAHRGRRGRGGRAASSASRITRTGRSRSSSLSNLSSESEDLDERASSAIETASKKDASDASNIHIEPSIKYEAATLQLPSQGIPIDIISPIQEESNFIEDTSANDDKQSVDEVSENNQHIVQNPETQQRGLQQLDMNSYTLKHKKHEEIYSTVKLDENAAPDHFGYKNYLDPLNDEATVADWLRHTAAIIAKLADEKMQNEIKKVKRSYENAVERALTVSAELAGS